MGRDGNELNIEQVFVGLRRAWYPPSAAIEASFTRLTQTLGGIFGALGADPDLAGLHGEIYRDFPGLAAGPDDVALAAPAAAGESGATDLRSERLRKGFYICNSLIQLMEDVYLDLRLEQDYRHPDNRGWMNLFRHWSQSDTFRLTWAVSASTYGLRFQDFCSRRLGLSLGSTDLKSIWDKRFSETPPLDAREADELLDASEQRMVEMLTSPNVRGTPNPIAERVQQIVVGRLVVPSNLTSELRDTGRRALTPEEQVDLARLTFGVAVLGMDAQGRPGRLLTVRVRRHLRSQGLGRKLVNDLVRRLGVRKMAAPRGGEMRQLGLSGAAEGRLGNLFKSVVNEVDLSEMRRAMSEPVGAVFGEVPLLPYSGVVRPPGVTWAHAIGFCYWVLSGADDEISPEELGATTSALKEWAGQSVDPREMTFVARDSLDWYLASKRPTTALIPEVDALIDQLVEQPWFDAEHRARMADGMEKIAWADAKRTADEDELVDRVLGRLALQIDSG